MSVRFNKLLDLIFVPRCASCKARMHDSSTGLCDICLDKYKDECLRYCDFCGIEAKACRCQPHLTLINGCSDYRKLVFYPKGNAKSVVKGITYGIKHKNNVMLTRFIASELAELDKNRTLDNAIVTFCPRSVKSVKKYGYDHAKMLATNYAEFLGIELQMLIGRRRFHKTSEQKLLNFNQRAANLKGAFYIKNEALIKGKTVVLIDDVVTSGATMGECMSLLYSAGAKDVICRSFAHTYRKNKSKND